MSNINEVFVQKYVTNLDKNIQDYRSYLQTWAALLLKTVEDKRTWSNNNNADASSYKLASMIISHITGEPLSVTQPKTLYGASFVPKIDDQDLAKQLYNESVTKELFSSNIPKSIPKKNLIEDSTSEEDDIKAIEELEDERRNCLFDNSSEENKPSIERIGQMLNSAKHLYGNINLKIKDPPFSLSAKKSLFEAREDNLDIMQEFYQELKLPDDIQQSETQTTTSQSQLDSTISTTIPSKELKEFEAAVNLMSEQEASQLLGLMTSDIDMKKVHDHMDKKRQEIKSNDNPPSKHPIRFSQSTDGTEKTASLKHNTLANIDEDSLEQKTSMLVVQSVNDEENNFTKEDDLKNIHKHADVFGSNSMDPVVQARLAPTINPLLAISTSEREELLYSFYMKAKHNVEAIMKGSVSEDELEQAVMKEADRITEEYINSQKNTIHMRKA